MPSYLVRETEEKHTAEDGSEKADTIEQRINDKCDEMANECADDVLGRLSPYKKQHSNTIGF